MKDWDIQIYRGILTGFNEAFIIDQKTKDDLIAKSGSTDLSGIIRPILRGRDIKKYNAKFADQWLINTHNGIKSNNTPPINVELDYPVVFQHLKKHETSLVKRLDKGTHWTNLRNCAYLPDLEKDKLIWIELTDHPNFTFDDKGFYLNNTIFFMTGSHLKYLLGYLNSRLCEWYFDKIAATSGVGTRRWIKVYIDQICVPKAALDEEGEINRLVNKALNYMDKEILKEIDQAFYKKFDLDVAEIEHIENANL